MRGSSVELARRSGIFELSAASSKASPCHQHLPNQVLHQSLLLRPFLVDAIVFNSGLEAFPRSLKGLP